MNWDYIIFGYFLGCLVSVICLLKFKKYRKEANEVINLIRESEENDTVFCLHVLFAVFGDVFLWFIFLPIIIYKEFFEDGE